MISRIVCLTLLALASALNSYAASAEYLSPTAIVAANDGQTLFVACGTASRVLRLDVKSKKVRDFIKTPSLPSGLALSRDGRRLYVTCASPESRVLTVDVPNGKTIGVVTAGHTAQAPVLSLDEKKLYVCNQFNNDLSVIDLAAERETGRIPVQREPIAADLTRDGKYLLVANHLSKDRSDSKNVAAVISVVDLAAGKTVKELVLPVGSEMLKDLRVAPDGKYAVVTHIFCNYDLPTRRVELGLINANALTLIALDNLEIASTFLLDTPQSGAGNPWGVAWSADSATLVVAHAGTQEASLIDFPALVAGLPKDEKTKSPVDGSTAVLKFVPHYEDEELNDGLPFLVGARRRIPLPDGDLGPRAVTVSGHTVYTANYFSDTLTAIDISKPDAGTVSVPLGPKAKMNTVRLGEFYFHDAALCHQGWQSCSSCHPGGGRVDGLNWDLASEGPGHPKNTKSILLAYDAVSKPGIAGKVMSMGDTPEAATRTAIKTLLFTNLPEAVALDMDAYLKSLKPVPSPYLIHGKLSPAAQQGEVLFTQAGCVGCHTPGLFTDRRAHDVGTVTRFDRFPQFRTPSLIEAWRTAPYLHSGSATTIRDVLTTCNPRDGRHGEVSGLSNKQIEDLCDYVLSL